MGIKARGGGERINRGKFLLSPLNLQFNAHGSLVKVLTPSRRNS